MGVTYGTQAYWSQAVVFDNMFFSPIVVVVVVVIADPGVVCWVVRRQMLETSRGGSG